MEALHTNKSLTYLNLSKVLKKEYVYTRDPLHFTPYPSTSTSITARFYQNLLGQMETLNLVQPDFTTGGEAIADMLRSNTTLTHLDVAWNYIRSDSAIEMGTYNLYYQRWYLVAGLGAG